jgi:enoyl-CoA hydratase/carnithine racemase
MSDILTERTENILRVTLNRPEKKNAMTSSMYTDLAQFLNDADNDDSISVVVLNGAGDSFTAANDVGDFLKNPPPPGDSPQYQLAKALIKFSKPLVAAVQGAAIGGGTTILTHCDFVYAGESTRFKLPFIDLALVPEFASSYSLPARIGYLRAAELFLLGQPFDAHRAAELGLVTSVVPDAELLATATATAQKLAEKPTGSLRATKRLLKQPFREQSEQAVQAEGEEFTARVRSAESKEAFTAFMEKRRPDFAKAKANAAQ